MTTCDPMLTRKQQILGRIESVCGTTETLTADDGKARIIVGATPEYAAPREKRDIAKSSLTPTGNLESTKANNFNFKTEINTPDAFSVIADMDIDSIAWQSGNIVRYDFSTATPDLSGIVAGDYLTANYCDDLINSGTFKIHAVSDVNDTIDVINRLVSDNTYDEVASAGVGAIQENIDVQWAINACSCKVIGCSRIPIGVIGVSSYVRGETITGAGGGTGRVIKGEVNGAAYLYFEPTSILPLLTTELITGGTSGATATSSAAPSVYGYLVQPVSDNQEVATIEQQQRKTSTTGYAWSARSSMGNLSIEAQANRNGFMDFSFQGPKKTNGDKAFTAVTRATEDPPIMKNAELTLGGTFKPVFKTFGLDLANEVGLRENGNAEDETGFETARIPERNPKFTISLEHELAATFDFFAKLDAGTKTSVQLHIGTVLGKQFWLFSDELEFEALPIEDQDGIVGISLEALCTGDLSDSDSNDDFEMLYI